MKVIKQDKGEAMREQFEKLPEIAERLNQGGAYWHGDKYAPKPLMNNFISTAILLNGAWYAYQEQQKNIDNLEKLVDRIYSANEDSEIKSIIDGWSF